MGNPNTTPIDYAAARLQATAASRLIATGQQLSPEVTRAIAAQIVDDLSSSVGSLDDFIRCAEESIRTIVVAGMAAEEAAAHVLTMMRVDRALNMEPGESARILSRGYTSETPTDVETLAQLVAAMKGAA